MLFKGRLLTALLLIGSTIASNGKIGRRNYPMIIRSVLTPGNDVNMIKELCIRYS